MSHVKQQYVLVDTILFQDWCWIGMNFWGKFWKFWGKFGNFTGFISALVIFWSEHIWYWPIWCEEVSLVWPQVGGVYINKSSTLRSGFGKVSKRSPTTWVNRLICRLHDENKILQHRHYTRRIGDSLLDIKSMIIITMSILTIFEEISNFVAICLGC